MQKRFALLGQCLRLKTGSKQIECSRHIFVSLSLRHESAEALYREETCFNYGSMDLPSELIMSSSDCVDGTFALSVLV